MIPIIIFLQYIFVKLKNFRRNLHMRQKNRPKPYWYAYKSKHRRMENDY
jgi:hypothetical protein